MPVDEEGVNNFFQKMGAKSNRLLVRPFRLTYYRRILWGALFSLLRPGYILAQIYRIPGAMSGRALQGVIMVKRE
mgnify:FL=1